MDKYIDYKLYSLALPQICFERNEGIKGKKEKKKWREIKKIRNIFNKYRMRLNKMLIFVPVLQSKKYLYLFLVLY